MRCGANRSGAGRLVPDLRDKLLEARAHVDGRPLQRPRILHEHPEVAIEVLVRPHRRVVDAHRVGHTIAIELHQVAVDVVLDLVVAERPVEAGLEGVAARHVRGLAGNGIGFRVDARSR